jgi:hypothetical protein
MRKSDQQGKNESSPSEVNLRDLGKVNTPPGRIGISLPTDDGNYFESRSAAWADEQPAPTLFAQHTLLRV